MAEGEETSKESRAQVKRVLDRALKDLVGVIRGLDEIMALIHRVEVNLAEISARLDKGLEKGAGREEGRDEQDHKV